MRQLAALMLLGLLAVPSVASAGPLAKPVGFGPLGDREAARQVDRDPWEPRPGNTSANHRIPGPKQLTAWRARSDMPYARFVSGHFRGTTDEIFQWAARKWGFAPNLLRAVAVVESWWRQGTQGDGGDSFGIFQVRRPYHCWGECLIARRSVAFNADYYGGILRAYFDGRMGWLNTVEKGKRYRPGDVWGSVGAWFSGRWWTEPSVSYIAVVKDRLAERTWTKGYFAAG